MFTCEGFFEVKPRSEHMSIFHGSDLKDASEFCMDELPMETLNESIDDFVSFINQPLSVNGSDIKNINKQ
jgi:hypothetical protein